MVKTSLIRCICAVALLTSGATNAFSFSLKSLSPRAWADRKSAQQFGQQEASEWYKTKTIEFLENFGVKDAHLMPIRQLAITAKPLIDAKFHLFPGLTTSTGIWLNESLLEAASEEVRIWYIAHEAAHVYRKDPSINNAVDMTVKMIPALDIFLTMGLGTWGMNFLAHRFAHVYNHQTFYKSIFLLLASAYCSADTIKSYQRLQFITFACKKRNEREADLTAARMLCEHGYAHVVEAHIAALNKSIEAGHMTLNSLDHPTLEEQRDYLQPVWDAWLANHPEYLAENVADVFRANSCEEHAEVADDDVVIDGCFDPTRWGGACDMGELDEADDAEDSVEQ